MNRLDAPMARTSDPLSSHIANRNIKNNVTLADNILCAVRNIYAQTPSVGVTDDQILEFVEALTQKRQQRNVIARARGLMERDGLLERIPSIDNSRVAVRPNKEWCERFCGMAS
jgi:hypothetical protein